MGDELTLKIGRRGAQLLLKELTLPTLQAYGDERRYLEAICRKLKNFIDTPSPRYVEYKIISIDGVPVEERHGSKEDRE